MHVFSVVFPLSDGVLAIDAPSLKPKPTEYRLRYARTPAGIASLIRDLETEAPPDNQMSEHLPQIRALLETADADAIDIDDRNGSASAISYTINEAAPSQGAPIVVPSFIQPGDIFQYPDEKKNDCGMLISLINGQPAATIFFSRAQGFRAIEGSPFLNDKSKSETKEVMRKRGLPERARRDPIQIDGQGGLLIFSAAHEINRRKTLQ